MNKTFRVALTADFFQGDGHPKYPMFDLSVLDRVKGVEYAPFNEHSPEIQPEQLNDVQGVIVLTPCVTKESLKQSDNLLAVGRFGVGYDSVDVAACTEAGVCLFITAGAVDRPVAEATVGWMIALSHHMRAKDLMVRNGDWQTRSDFMGTELRERRLGVIGFGGIGRALTQLLAGFGMNKPLVYDPFLDEDLARESGVQLVELDELLSEADFVSLHCPLNEQTTNLIAERELSLMKSTSYLINTARGGIVDEDALYDALSNRRIAGAAIDCFVDEPVTTPHRLGELDNVVLAPHCVAWTEELFRDIGASACQGMLDLARGIKPKGVVNPEVFGRASFQDKWKRLMLESETTSIPAGLELK